MLHLTHLAKCTVVTALGATLAGGALVAATTGAASAANVSAPYTCDVLGTPTQFTLAVDALLPPTVSPSAAVPGGLLGFTGKVTVPASTAATLSAFGVNGGTSADSAISFGGVNVPAPLKATSLTANPDGTATFNGTGSIGAFTTPATPGPAVVKLPTKFTLVPTANGTALPVSVTCTTTTPATLGTVTVTPAAVAKQATKTKVSKPKAVKASKHAKLKVKVTNAAKTAVTGKVLVKEGHKTVGKGTVKAGKVTVKIKRLKKGTHKLRAYFKGSASNATSKSKTTKLVVKK